MMKGAWFPHTHARVHCLSWGDLPCHHPCSLFFVLLSTEAGGSLREAFPVPSSPSFLSRGQEDMQGHTFQVTESASLLCILVQPASLHKQIAIAPQYGTSSSRQN